jgi:uncharacterized protein (TIGR01777 family)
VRIAITGSTGLVGTALVRHFRASGDEVTRVVRSYAGITPQERAVVWNPREGTIETEGLRGHDVVIHLAGETIAGVWTPGRKSRIRRSRVDGTTLLARTLAALPERPPLFISGSATGYYGTTDKTVDESGSPGTGFLAGVVREWESSTAAATAAGIRVVHLRLGNVLAGDGGVLGALLPLFRLGLGARFGDGRQCWPWISIDEIAPVVRHLIAHEEIHGPVNAVAPSSSTNGELTTLLARVVKRPSILTVPAFAARLAPGGMGEEILLGGACVVPARLLQTGYHFRYPDLESTLRALLRG